MTVADATGRNLQRGPHLRDLRRGRQAEQGADLLVAGQPAPGGMQQGVAGRVFSNVDNTLMGCVQPPEQPAGPSEQDEEPDSLAPR
jgi:hypothetical protein